MTHSRAATSIEWAAAATSGHPLDVPFAHVWNIRHGKAVRFHQFTDTRGEPDALA